MGVEKALSGDLEHNAGQTGIKRAIPKNYKYDPKAIKPLAKMLWSMSVSLGHALAAHKSFVRLKSATISPDGLVGGRGYVMAVKDVRNMLHDACEALSALCDTVHDEINGPHWQPRLAELEKEEVDRIKSLMGDAERYLANPEEEAEDEEEETETSGHAEWHHPAVQKDNKSKKDPKSQVPDGGDKETSPEAQPLRPDMRKSPVEKHASSGTGDWYDPRDSIARRVASKFLQANPDHVREERLRETEKLGKEVARLVGEIDKLLLQASKAEKEGQTGRADGLRNKIRELRHKLELAQHDYGAALFHQQQWEEKSANSSLPVETMPGGPRIDHLDRGDTDQTGPFGTYDHEHGKPDDEEELSDKWRRDDGFGNDYNYPSDWSNDLHEKQAGQDSAHSAMAPAIAEYQPAIIPEEDPEEEPDGPLRYPPPGFGDPQAASAFPDANSDGTPTEGFDFGIGYGDGNDAHGQGAGGYGEGNPAGPDTNPGGGTGNRGVYGPQSGLPKDPGGKVNPDDSDSTLVIENEIGGKGRFSTFISAELLHEIRTSMFMEPIQNFDFGAVLPGDEDAGVARSDYYDGPKPSNMQNTAPSNVGATRLLGEQIPAKLTPITPRPSHNQEHMFGTGELPGDGQRVDYDYNRDLGPDQTTTFEQMNTPYIKWDDNTHEMRPDPIHQRGPVTGPYVHNDLADRPSHG